MSSGGSKEKDGYKGEEKEKHTFTCENLRSTFGNKD
jgi:hypothetical protein